MSSPSPSSSVNGAPSSTNDGKAHITPKKPKSKRVPSSAPAKLFFKKPKHHDPNIIFDRHGRFVSEQLPLSLRSMGFQQGAETVRISGCGRIGSILGLASSEFENNLVSLQQKDKKLTNEALLIEGELKEFHVEHSDCTAQVQKLSAEALEIQSHLTTELDKIHRLDHDRIILLEQKTKNENLRHLVRTFLAAHDIIAQQPLGNATHAEARAYVGVGSYQDVLNLSNSGIIRKLRTLNNAGFAQSPVFCASWLACPGILLTYIGKDPHN